MTRRTTIAISALAVASLSLFSSANRPDGSDEEGIQSVFVTNFPALQKVEGQVEVVGPVHLSKLVTLENITVPPVPRTDTTRLVEAGVLVAEGFPSVVLSLHGVVKGSVTKRGAVGAILVPDQQRIQEAFREQGLMQFSMDTVAGGIEPETSYFASGQPRYTIGFPRYKVLLYNTTDKAVTADFFAYLTN